MPNPLIVELSPEVIPKAARKVLGYLVQGLETEGLEAAKSRFYSFDASMELAESKGGDRSGNGLGKGTFRFSQGHPVGELLSLGGQDEYQNTT